jgi:hypothetical protein
LACSFTITVWPTSGGLKVIALKGSFSVVRKWALPSSALTSAMNFEDFDALVGELAHVRLGVLADQPAFDDRRGPLRPTNSQHYRAHARHGSAQFVTDPPGTSQVPTAQGAWIEDRAGAVRRL